MMKSQHGELDHQPESEKLSAECPTHGTVSVVCPQCAGKAGGKAHRGTRSRRKKELEALQDARWVCEASPPLMQTLAEQEKRFQAVCDKLGMSAEERAAMREDMIRLRACNKTLPRLRSHPDARCAAVSFRLDHPEL
jgi:hypothetical protein